MKTLKLTCCILFTIFNLNAQNIHWAMSMGGVQSDGLSNFIIDNNDNIIMLANFSDTIQLDSNSVQGYQLIKFDSSGQYLWNIQLPNNFCFCTPPIITDNFNNIYIASDSLKKYSPTGMLLAVAPIPPITLPWNCSFFLGTVSLGVDIFGNIYITGIYFDWSLRLTSSASLLKGCDPRSFLMKYDSTLQFGWKIENDTNYYFAGYNLLPGVNGEMFVGSYKALGKIDSTGAILGVSTLSSSATYNSSFLRYNSFGQIVSNDGLNSVAIFDTSANLISNTSPPFANANPNSFEIINDTTYVFGSSFWGTVVVSNPWQQFYTSLGGTWNRDFLLVYYDSSFNNTSTVHLGGIASEYIQMKKFSNGDLLLAGSYGRANDGSATYFDIGSYHFMSNGNTDIFLARTSPQFSYIIPSGYSVSKEVELFPNPPSTVLNFLTSNVNSQINKVEIFDMTGKSILVRTENNLKELSVKNLSKGMYIAKISTEKNILYKKFLKE